MSLFSARVKSALAAASDYLTDLADKTKIPNDRVLYLDTMHELGFNTKGIITKFDQTMIHAFDALNEDFGVADGIKRDESVSSASAGLEERLAIDTMCSRARTLTEMQLHSVKRTLNGIMGDDWVQHNGNPLDPENVIKAWVAAIHVVQLEPKGNLAMYGLLNKKVLAALPAMYEDIISFLGKLSSSRSSRFKQSDKPIGDQETDYELAFGDIDDKGDLDGFSNIQAVQTNKSTAHEHDAVPEPELRTDELVSLLDKLQRNRELDDGSFYGGNHLLDLRGLLAAFNAIPNAEISPWTIGQINDDVIDLTGLLFTFIMEDMHIPDDVRFQMSRLQIPYLKLALQDKNIFIDKHHPARQLLNDLSQAVFECDPRITGGLEGLHAEICSAIDKLLIEYHTDTQIFDSIQQQFSVFLSGGEKADKAKQQNTSTPTSKADNARLAIESTLDELCKNKRIPPVVNKIIENFWSKVLFLEYIKAGEDSEDYATFIETVKMLVESVQPKGSELSRKSMAKILPVLIKRLKEGLATISIASFEAVDIFRELQDCHMLVLKERPELEVEAELEVPEEQYEEFKHSQNKLTDWNRNDLENALLEESIERSMGYSDSDTSAFDYNENIIVSQNNFDDQTATAKSSRERDSIDHQLNEARDAYEQAIKDHHQKKGLTPDHDDDENDEDPMVQFFQDPNFAQKQAAKIADSASKEDEPVDDAVFNDIEEDIILTDLPNHHDELEGRAHGALDEEDEQLGDQQVVELIERLKVGIWVDFIHADGVQVRAKIMAIVPTVGKYIFGDRGGRKLADYHR